MIGYINTKDYPTSDLNYWLKSLDSDKPTNQNLLHKVIDLTKEMTIIKLFRQSKVANKILTLNQYLHIYIASQSWEGLVLFNKKGVC